MLEQNDYRTFLKEELSKRLKANARYSQRAYARDLGLSPGELSEILRGKRKLSAKKAILIASRLGLNSFETSHFVELLGKEMNPEGPEKSKSSRTKKSLEADLFQIVSDWYCFGILNLSECEGFRWSHNWIARKLGITPFQVKVALERMMRVGLIIETKNGLKACEDFVFSPDGIPSEAIKSYHKDMLKKAEQALITQNIDERDISGLGFAVDPAHIPAIKKDIADFRNQLVEKYSKGKKTKVYQLELAFFQLTEGETHERD